MRRRFRLGSHFPGLCESLCKLAHLVLEVRERTRNVRVLEVDRRSALLHLARIEQGGERVRNVVEHARASLLLRLDLLPAYAHTPGRLRLGVAEDVRMAAHELLVDRLRDVLETGAAPLRQQEREEVHLEQEVAQLVGQLRVVALDCGVGDLVRLLERVRDDRPLGLLAVPRALAPQPLRQRLEVRQRLGEAHFVAVVVPTSEAQGSGFGW